MKELKLLKNRTRVKEVLSMEDGKEIVVAGFVKNIRNKGKNLKFIIIDDGSSEIQITCLRNIMEDKINELNEIHSQSVLLFEGKIQKTDLSKSGIEILAENFEVISHAEPQIPIDFGNIESSFEKRLNWRNLDLRNEKRRIVLKLHSEFERFSREFFYDNNLTEIHSSKLMKTASESGAEVFEIKYFEGKAYLAQSPQFYKQMAISSGFESIFEIGPVFRAESSFTSKHTTEFISLDVEIGYIDSEEDVMLFQEKWINYTITKLKEKYGNKIKEYFGIEIEIPKLPFPRITMSEAYKVLKEKGIEFMEGGDLSSEGEKELAKQIKETTGHDFVFLTEFPWSVRPFYHMRPEEKSKTRSYDLIFKGIEITTGAQREHRYEILKEQAIEKGLSVESLNDYLNFFKYGCPSHGGFGMSPARFIMCLLELENIREATFNPRDPKRLNP